MTKAFGLLCAIVGALLAAAVVTATQAAPEAINIALVATISGNFSDVGEFDKNAAEMAVNDINRAGGVKAFGGARLNLVVINTTSSASDAVSNVQRALSKQSQIVAAFGNGISGIVLPLQPIFERAKIPFLVQGTSDQITSKGYTYTFEFVPRGSQFGAMQVDFVEYLNKRYNLGIEKAAVLYENSAYGTAVAQGIGDLAKKAHLELVMNELFATGLTDATPIVEKLANSGAQVFFPVGYSNDTLLIVNTMRAKHLKMPIIAGGAGFIWPVFQKSGGERVNGVFSIASWNWDSKNIVDDPARLSIVQRYPKLYGTFMPEQAGTVYAEVYAILDAIDHSKSLDPTKIRDALSSMTVESGPVGLIQPGKVKFAPNGQDTEIFPVLIQWQDQVPVTVYPEQAASKPVDISYFK